MGAACAGAPDHAGPGEAEATRPYLEPLGSFALTGADIALDGSLEEHEVAVRAWGADTWSPSRAHHGFIRAWVITAQDDIQTRR